jgi:hypothetical protein
MTMTGMGTMPDIQGLGEKVLNLVTGVLRALELYDLHNQTVQNLISELVEEVNNFSQDSSANVALLTDDENIFLNEEFLRLERRAFEKVARLRKMFGRLRVNEISFYPGCSQASLTLFFERVNSGVRTPADRVRMGLPDDTHATLRFVPGISKHGKSQEDKESLAIRLHATLLLLSRELLYQSTRQPFPPTVRLRRVLQRIVDLLDDHGDYVLTLAHHGGKEDGLAGHLARSAVLSAALARTTGMEKRRIGRAALGVFVGHLPMARLGDSWNEASPERIEGVYEEYMAMVLREGQFSGVSAWRLAMLHEAQLVATGQSRAYPGDLKTSFDGRLLAICTTYDRTRVGIGAASSKAPPAAVADMAAEGKAQQGKNDEQSVMDWRLIAMFLRLTGPMPPGTLVRLEDGTYGLIRNRPEVVLVADHMGNPLPDFDRRDVTEATPYDLPDTIDIAPAIGWQMPGGQKVS